MPTECPKQRVMPLVMMKRKRALQVRDIGPRVMARKVIVPIQSDFDGHQRTFPSSGLVKLFARMRSEPGSSFIRLASLPPRLLSEAAPA
jgi:hypothetical protein